MKFIRIFWGDLDEFDGKFANQIKNVSTYNFENEIVFVWGTANDKFLTDLGYKTHKISDLPFNPDFSSKHHMYDHKGLIHKLFAFDLAVQMYGEVVFIDWDCYKVKDIDSNFYDLIKGGNELQVPLYAYPIEVLHNLTVTIDITYKSFFSKLSSYLEKYAYIYSDSYIIPNTGFMYCRNKEVSHKLLNIALEHKLETVPDELSVLLYSLESNFDTLEDYINKFEPRVIFGKHAGEADPIWNEHLINLYSFIETKINKEIYFHHV